MKTVTAFAPATIANLSCGFDIFGIALDNPGDEVTLTLKDAPGVRIVSIHGDEGRLPKDPHQNTASVAVLEFLKSIGKPDHGVDVELRKNLPLGSGMGSSAASAVAAVVGINTLMGEPYSRTQLLPFVMEAERVACGSAHADNVAPGLFGGLALIRSSNPLDIITIPTPPELVFALIHPHLEVKTRDARKVLKPVITLKDGITQWANTAALVAGMMQSDYALIGRALEDKIAEPTRSILIPNFYAIKAKAVESGALACGISGSGPTIFCACQGQEKARRAAAAVQDLFRQLSLDTEIFLSPINIRGAYVLATA